MIKEQASPVVEIRSVDSIIPYANNPRDNNEIAVDKISQSIRQFGFNVPIVVDGAGVIVAGHTRKRWTKWATDNSRDVGTGGL